MIIKSIILGIIQGLTEFLPVSSSGHLAILEKYFGITEPVVLATFLHLGTFLATVVFFFRPITDLLKGVFTGEKKSINYALSIAFGSIPIMIFALLLRTQIEQTFSNMALVSIFLGITGLVLIMTMVSKRGNKQITIFSAVIIGIAQMFATFPGISRSGMTISAGFFAKVSPQESFKFSFLLSLPAILGANILELMRFTVIDNPLGILIGMLCSFVFGLVALRILRLLVQKHFHLFGIYCLVVSIIILLLK
ncbi:MAG: undecaprenyl-diphosphate phosphatase [bacterium]